MISAGQLAVAHVKLKSFSAIARSVMISASFMRLVSIPMRRFSAIARSVMISALRLVLNGDYTLDVSVL